MNTTHWDTDSLALLKNILSEASENAAKAFTIFTKLPIKVEFLGVDLENNPFERKDEKDDFFVIISDLKGGLEGKCYLKLPLETCQLIYKQCLGDYHTIDEMQTEVLKEFGNILTASVVSILSNKLKVVFFAHVPHLHEENKLNFNKFIKNSFENEANKTILISHYKLYIADYYYEFFWILDKTRIKQLLADIQLK